MCWGLLVMSIRTRLMALMAGFAVTALIIAALGLMTLSDYQAMMAESSRAWENSWRGERLNHLVSNVVMESRGIYASTNPAETAMFAGSLNRNLDAIETLLGEWKAAGPAEAKLVAGVEPDVVPFIGLRRQLARLALAGRIADAHALGLANRADRTAFQNHLDTLVVHIRTDLDAVRQRAARYSRMRALEFAGGAGAGLLLTSALALWALARFVTRPLKALARAIIDTAESDYSVPLPAPRGQDEISTVWRALNVLKERAIEAERLAIQQREAEHQKEIELRQLILD
jgi:methyl-accepting chemotaxis protein